MCGGGGGGGGGARNRHKYETQSFRAPLEGKMVNKLRQHNAICEKGKRKV